MVSSQRAEHSEPPHDRLVEHPGARVAAAIDALKDAADKLYDAVLSLPFEPTEPLPKNKSEVARYVVKCRKWHDHAVKRFNNAAVACDNPISDTLQLSALIGRPAFGDESFEYNRDGVGGQFSRHQMAKFDNRVNAVHSGNLRGIHDFGIKAQVFPRERQAQLFVLDLQFRSRALVRWLYEVIDRHADMSLPRITVIEGSLRQSIARLEMAGARRDRPIQDKQRDLLLELATMVPVAINGLYVRTRLYKRVPELDGLIHTVDARLGIDPTVKLDVRMTGRIKSA